MTPDDRHELMLAYVVGCTDDDECQRIKAWLASGDVTAHAAYAEAIAVMHALPMAISPIEPPNDLKDRVLKRCGCKKTFRNVFGQNWMLYTATGLAACLAVALTVTLVQERRDSSRWQDVERVMASPYVSFAKLNATPVSTQARPQQAGYGRMLYCPVTKLYELNVFDLTPPPPGRVYQLWLITPEKKPMPAGTFSVHEDGQGTMMVAMPQAPSNVTAAITDEPEGGSQTPTGTICLSGQLTPAAGN